MRWYVSRAGETAGPLAEEEVRAMARKDGLRGAQVRDEVGGGWTPAEKSPFGSLMKERGLVGPIVAGVVVMLAARLFVGLLVTETEGAAANLGANGPLWVMSALVGLAGFGLLALLRRL